MRQFHDWRHTKGAVNPPQAYIDYILCTHVYHCTPDQLDELPASATGLHLAFYNEEQAAKHPKKNRVLKGRRKRGAY